VDLSCVGFNILLDTLHGILETIFSENISTDAKYPITWTDVDKTKHNYNHEQCRNLNNNASKLLTKAWFMGSLCQEMAYSTAVGAHTSSESLSSQVIVFNDY